MSSPTRSPSLESITSSALPNSGKEYTLESTPLDCSVRVERTTISKPMQDRGRGTEIDASFMEWAEFKAWKQQRDDLQATNSAPKAIERHARFFLPAENIFFLVGSTLYSVPRAPFERHSSTFVGKGLTQDVPLTLEDVQVSHLDHFLSILFPFEYGMYTASTVEEWTAILHLAEKWCFRSIRDLAIRHLTPIANDIDKIILGRQFGISQWLGGAYLAVCMREKNLTEEEGRGMDVEDIIKISSIRQQFGLGARPQVTLPLSIGEVHARFGLTKYGPPPTDIECATFIAPSASSEISPVDPDEGRDGPNQEPAVVTNELSSEAKVKATAELERAERAKERERTERALKAYVASPLCPTLQGNDLARFRDAKSAIQVENRKQELLDFIASYKDETSESI
ncbi:hypothetical protein FIBSPDRAFT_828733 [Athelia psychrophila]|uniref:BTB domain-containing protein n=1 Tax=Athelia psychrophila TaxID=1759441 RepID=A0A166HJ73_9AGAM|nr:hypothetical protein FIBSPDRAFT_828733 [Fibularhizoctonia sp. CBS 109695]